MKRRGRFGQVVVEQVIPTEPDPVTPVEPVRPKKPPGMGAGEPVVPVIVEGSPEVDLLDQAAAAGGEAAVDWAEDAGFSTDDAAQYGALYATELALELVCDSDLGEGSLGAGRCLLAEVLSRVGERLGGLHGHASGWQLGSAACDSPTPHAIHSTSLNFASALQHQPINEMHKASMVACVICDDCVPCVIADQILSR